MKFRKKPVVIEALQLTRDKDRAEKVRAWCGAEICYEGLRIKTLEGVMLAQFGDWIIRGVKGEFYPCKPDIFEATYDAVEDQDSCDHNWIRDAHDSYVGGHTAHCVKCGEGK